MSWVLYKRTGDRYDDVYGSAVLVFNNQADANKFLDRCNSVINRYKKQVYNLNTLGILREEIKPTYELMVRIAGPKPLYDHTFEKNAEYNKKHQDLVVVWKQKFEDWKKVNPHEWMTIVKTELVPDIVLMDPIEYAHPVLDDLEDHVFYNGLGHEVITEIKFWIEYVPDWNAC